MRATSVIIICSGQSHYADLDILDRVIETAVAEKKNPILVLGPDGDDFLRTSKRIDDCEIVFDPNFKGELFSSIKAGLHVTKNAALVVPLNENAVDPELWQKLESELLPKDDEKDSDEKADIDVIRPVTHNSELDCSALPQLITRQGVQKLRNLSAQTSWATSKAFTTRTIDI